MDKLDPGEFVGSLWLEWSSTVLGSGSECFTSRMAYLTSQGIALMVQEAGRIRDSSGAPFPKRRIAGTELQARCCVTWGYKGLLKNLWFAIKLYSSSFCDKYLQLSLYKMS